MAKGVVSGGLTSPVHNVDTVTNTSSSSCANNGRRGECSAPRSPPSVAALFFTVCDSYGWQHCRPVCSEARYSYRIAFFAYPTRIFDVPVRGRVRRNIAIPFRMATRWWKKFEDMFIRFDMIHERDRRTDGRTDTGWRHRPRLCIALRGKNHPISIKFGTRQQILNQVTATWQKKFLFKMADERHFEN